MHAKRASRHSPQGAPTAPREPPSPKARAPQLRLMAAPAMSVAAAKDLSTSWDTVL